MFSLGSSEGERGGGTLGISAEVLITPISFWMILFGGLRGDGGEGGGILSFLPGGTLYFRTTRTLKILVAPNIYFIIR